MPDKTQDKKFPKKPRIDGKCYHALAFVADKSINPSNIKHMTCVAEKLAKKGFTIRVGTGKLAESIKKAIPKDQLEQFAPWEGFENSADIFSKATNHAKAIAMTLKVRLSDAKPSVWAIVGVYVNIIMGKDVRSLATAMICWTPTGSNISKGNERTSISMSFRAAWLSDIPVYQTGSKEDLMNLKDFIENKYPEFEKGKWSRDLFAFNPKK